MCVASPMYGLSMMFGPASQGLTEERSWRLIQFCDPCGNATMELRVDVPSPSLRQLPHARSSGLSLDCSLTPDHQGAVYRKGAMECLASSSSHIMLPMTLAVA